MPNEVKGKLDGMFEKMAKALSRKQRISVNKAGMKPYKEEFTKNFKESFREGKGESILETLSEHATTGGRVELGFSKKGKKAYLARFHNDGWIPRNQYGGPYKYHPNRVGNEKGLDDSGLPMVPGKHFWEKTNSDASLKEKIRAREIRKYHQILDEKVKGG